MASEENPKQVGMETGVPFDDLCVEEIQQLKIVRVKSVREGADPSCSYHFSPSTRGLPDDFLCMDGITWKSCDEAALSRTVRNWVQHLREKGDLVELSSSPVGILRFRLNFHGEHIVLWFNAWTSTTVVIGGDGKIRKPFFQRNKCINSTRRLSIMCFPETKDDEDVDAHQDTLYLRAVELIRKTGRASISYLQRQLGMGYNDATKTIDLLEERGIITPPKAPNGQREILN